MWHLPPCAYICGQQQQQQLTIPENEKNRGQWSHSAARVLCESRIFFAKKKFSAGKKETGKKLEAFIWNPCECR
jgi:hypothetical protein